jgi:hypothetical protein
MSQPQEIKLPSKKAQPAASDAIREEEIRVLAYEFHQQRGGEDGYAIEDWLRAEEEIRRQAGNRKAA